VPVARVDGPAAREEAGLVAQVAAGDTGAPMTELYHRYAARLYRYGVHALGDGRLAEEMVQECFIRLWRTAGRFDPARGTVAAYLIVIGRSVAADVRKRPSSRRLEQLEEALVPQQPDSVDQILCGLMVREAVDSLSPAHRQVIMLAEAGLTQSQIAEQVGLPLGTVKTRTFHALRALRGVLARQGIHAAA
jgi:RNA polymerase sigma-70 factor, ECF subfamily